MAHIVFVIVGFDTPEMRNERFCFGYSPLVSGHRPTWWNGWPLSTFIATPNSSAPKT